MKELKLLGFKAQDKVTGFKGVITSVSFDLFGCIQAALSAPEKDGKIGESYWLDTNRMKILSKTPVMKCRHNFERDDTGANNLSTVRKVVTQ